MAFQILERLMPNHWCGYGVLYPGFAGIKLEKPSIKAYAELMLEEIKHTQPQGPYFFVGYSMGGHISIEMAKILIQEGQKVGVVLVDSRIPGRAILKSFVRRIPGRLKRSLENLVLRFKGGKQELQKRRLEERMRLSSETEEDLPDAFNDVIKEGREAIKTFTPQKIDVATVLIKSQKKTFNDSRFHQEEDYGWSLFTNLLNVVVSPGDHLRMIKPPNDKIYIGNLSSALDTLKNNVS